MDNVEHHHDSTAFGPYLENSRNQFDFTLLFEQSILSIGPSALLVLIFPVRLGQLFREKIKTYATIWLIAKLVGGLNKSEARH